MTDQAEEPRNQASEWEALGPGPFEMIKEYGKKASMPLLSVVHKYRDHFSPYFDAISCGLHASVEALERDGANDADRFVARLFREAEENISEARQKLATNDLSDFGTYALDLANKKPGLMFSASYIVGLFAGRLSKHVYRAHGASASPAAGTPAGDESIH